MTPRFFELSILSNIPMILTNLPGTIISFFRKTPVQTVVTLSWKHLGMNGVANEINTCTCISEQKLLDLGEVIALYIN